MTSDDRSLYPDNEIRRLRWPFVLVAVIFASLNGYDSLCPSKLIRELFDSYIYSLNSNFDTNIDKLFKDTAELC